MYKKYSGYYIAFICLGLITVGCGNDITTINAVVKADELGVEKASGVEMLYSDSAVVRVRVKAKEMLHYIDPAKPKRTFPKGILVDFFDKNKQQVSKLKSKYATRDENTSEVHLRDSVVIWNTKSERMETDELWWNEPQSRIYSDKDVTITTPTEIIKGKGFESNADFSHWTLREVTGRVQAKTLFKDGF